MEEAAEQKLALEKARKKHKKMKDRQHKQHGDDKGGQPQKDHVDIQVAVRTDLHHAAMHDGSQAADSEAAASNKPFDRQKYVIDLLTSRGGNFKDLPGVAKYDDLDEEYERLLVDGDGSVSIEAAIAKEEEVWVLKLPDGVDIEALDNCTLHLPCEPPEARHLDPPKDLLSGRYDLLAYVKAAVKPAHIGHLELAADKIVDEHAGNVAAAYRELHQEGEYVAAKLRCAGPTHDGIHEKLKSVRVARVINVSEDVLTLNRQGLALAMVQGRQQWGDCNGWDGELPPRKRRKRVAGWDVVGDKQVVNDESSDDLDDPFKMAFSSSESEEEFDEVVFLPEKEQPILKEELEKQQKEAEGKDEAKAAAELQQQLMETLAEDVKDPVDWDERWYEGDHWDPLTRYQQQQQVPGPSTQPDIEEEEEPDIDLYEFFMSLPVRADVAAEQQAYAEKRAAHAWHQQYRAQGLQPDQQHQPEYHHGQGQHTQWQQHTWQYSAGQQADWQPGAGQSQGFQTHSGEQRYNEATEVMVISEEYSPSTPSSAGEGDDAWPDDDHVEPTTDQHVVVVDTDSWEEEHEPAAGVDEQMTQPTADKPAQGNENKKRESKQPPPRTVAEMLAPVEHEEDFIQQMPTYDLQVRLRNIMVKEVLGYEELCQQVDMDAMSDDAILILLQLLLEYKRQRDGDEFEDLEPEQQEQRQVASILLPSGGFGPRPCFKQVDQGYAPYQVDDEGREVVVIPPPSPDWQVTDEHLAERMIKRGAGKLHRFVTTEELRSKGFEWDSDDEEDRREGLSITLPDGTSMHIPSGLHLPTS